MSNGPCTGVVELVGEGAELGFGEIGEEQFRHGRDGDGDGLADPRVHPHRVAALDLVDVQHLGLLVHGEVDGVPAQLVQPYEMGVGDLADVEVLHRLLGEGDEAGAEAVALVGLAVDHAVFVERAEESQRGGLVDAEAVGDLTEVGGALGQQRQDAECAVDGLTHGVRTSSGALPACVQPGPSRSVPHASSATAASRSVVSRVGVPRGRRGW